MVPGGRREAQVQLYLGGQRKVGLAERFQSKLLPGAPGDTSPTLSGRERKVGLVKRFL